MTYAENTTVTADRSRAEIERTLTRYGASAFAYGWDQGQAAIGFQAHGRRIQFHLPLPDRNERRFTHTPTGGRRGEDGVTKEWERACRQRWRALALVIKAKLEAVEAGIVEFEDEFLAQTVLPSGGTVASWLQPQIQRAYETGEMPSMLPALGAGD